jgi:hypothetical protein
MDGVVCAKSCLSDRDVIAVGDKDDQTHAGLIVCSPTIQ